VHFDGYLYTGGSFTTIDVPGAPNTNAQGINDSGQIVGYFWGFGPAAQGFVFTGGNFTTFNVPGAVYTLPNGINNSGQIVGSFFDASGVAHGFVYTGGSFTTIDVPGATGTVANGINNSGQIVGFFGAHGFVYTGGSFTIIDVPGATVTTPIGINDSGQIVGYFVDATGGEHGFLATPISPVSEPLVVGVGDFNGDGHADVLWFNANSGALVEWLLDGQGNVMATPSLSLPCDFSATR
jgi:probable HAF family extracellular repeat protein